MIREILTGVFLLFGGILTLIAAVGVLRLPDVYTRMHAAAKVGTVGVSSVAIGVMIHFGTLTVTSRGLLVIAFFLLTAPVAAHMIARSAYRSGVSLWILTRLDEWKTHGEIDKGE
jgi:multicomponent Na+:H+ antiporter subunit G